MKRLRGAGALLGLTLVTTSCGLGGESTDDAGGGADVVFASQFPPIAAWALETDDASLLTRAGCLETLVRYDYDGSLQPSLADSWEQTSPTEWTFELRSDVEFQDGTPMDADTVAEALTHTLEAPTPARSFNPDAISQVEAVGESTVTVTTPVPDVLLPYRLASWNAGILAPKAYTGDTIDIVGTCTGPFTVTSQDGTQSIQLERNEGYWGDKAKIATAEMRFVIDGQARVTQLQAGEADIVESIPPSSMAQLDGDDTVEIVRLAIPRVTSIVLNTARSPFDDPLVRQALQHAVDTQAIADIVYEGAAKPANGPFSPDDPWASQGAEPVALDQDEALKLFEQAGVDPSDLTIELIAYKDRPEFADLAAVIQDQLGQLGIRVKIKAGEYASFEPDLLEGEFDAALLSRGYMTDVGDPAGYLRSDFTCEGGYNIAHYCDSGIDSAVQDAITTGDPDSRHEQYAAIGEQLQTDAAQIFLVNNTALNAVDSSIAGYEIHPLNYYVLTSDLGLD